MAGEDATHTAEVNPFRRWVLHQRRVESWNAGEEKESVSAKGLGASSSISSCSSTMTTMSTIVIYRSDFQRKLSPNGKQNMSSSSSNELAGVPCVPEIDPVSVAPENLDDAFKNLENISV